MNSHNLPTSNLYSCHMLPPIRHPDDGSRERSWRGAVDISWHGMGEIKMGEIYGSLICPTSIYIYYTYIYITYIILYHIIYIYHDQATYFWYVVSFIVKNLQLLGYPHPKMIFQKMIFQYVLTLSIQLRSVAGVIFQPLCTLWFHKSKVVTLDGWMAGWCGMMWLIYGRSMADIYRSM